MYILYNRYSTTAEKVTGHVKTSPVPSYTNHSFPSQRTIPTVPRCLDFTSNPFLPNSRGIPAVLASGFLHNCPSLPASDIQLLLTM